MEAAWRMMRVRGCILASTLVLHWTSHLAAISSNLASGLLVILDEILKVDQRRYLGCSAEKLDQVVPDEPK